MRCPWCGAADDRVVDSREVEQGLAIRRRRECVSCSRRFTTYERAGGAVVFVLKRSGQREPFERQKVVAGVRAACKNRPVDIEAIETLASDVEDFVRSSGPEITSEGVGLAVLERLRLLDDVASVRFASVYKGFEDVGDFTRELGLLREDRDGRGEGPPAHG
ncbi:MAG: transcriptional regulator NrdR [Acidimicrobiales bacterium]